MRVTLNRICIFPNLKVGDAFKKKKLVAKSYYSWIEKKCLIANSVSRTDVNSIKHIKLNEKKSDYLLYQ